ncbi:MAG: hypothetical protein AB1813_21110 [Verrucomicrobiota bacterium]
MKLNSNSTLYLLKSHDRFEAVIFAAMALSVIAALGLFLNQMILLSNAAPAIARHFKQPTDFMLVDKSSPKTNAVPLSTRPQATNNVSARTAPIMRTSV